MFTWFTANMALNMVSLKALQCASVKHPSSARGARSDSGGTGDNAMFSGLALTSTPS